MCKEIDRNVELMGRVMIQMDQFTEEELIATLHKRKKVWVFPLFWSIRRHLEYYEELGALHSKNGRYQVVHA